MAYEEEPKKGRGCLFYGCLTLLVLLVVVIAGSIFGLWQLKKYAFEKFTETKPLEFSEETYSPETAANASKKIQAFSQILEQKKEPATLTLTADEINALIAYDENFNTLNMRAEVAFEEDTAMGKISLPLDNMLPFDLGKGRFLNGAATLDISTQDGELFVFIQSLEVKGEPLPEYIMNELRKENFAKNTNEDPEQAETLSHLKSIDIKDGKMIITATPAD
jgi:hypothetical protein